jgi:hypothetical protein
VTVADILGQDGERRLALTGWIGEHPATGADVAHLLLYPLGHGVAAKMRAVAELLDLRGALAGPVHTSTAAYLTVDDDGPHAQIRTADTALLIERPVTAEWAVAARTAGQVMLTAGQDGYTGHPRELERYLARGRRLSMALLDVRL